MKKPIQKILDAIFNKIKYRIYYSVKSVEKEFSLEKINNLKNRVAIHGEELYINGDITITEPKMVVIGSNVHIGNNAYFNTGGGLIIGDNVHFSRNVAIYTTSHNYNGALPYDNKLITKGVTIEKNVWIGMNVNITPGVTIGEGAIIGMGACVTKDVPAYSIVGNQSYRVLKERDITKYNEQEKQGIYGGINGQVLDSNNFKYVTGEELGEKLFFIVSTGRSGTTSFASILSQHPDIECKHEITDILIKISSDYAHNNITEEEALKVLADIYCKQRIFKKGKYFGESNQKLSNLIPLIHKLLPKAKFIGLIRDGKEVVDSTYSRGWYSNEHNANQTLRDPSIMNWHNYRIMGDKSGSVNVSDWNSMTRFEKNCWYWNYWNSIIIDGFKLLPEQNKLFIRLEDKESNFKKIKNFLTIKDNFYFIEEKRNIAHYKLKGVSQWSDKEHKAFDDFCGKLYSKYYSK